MRQDRELQRFAIGTLCGFDFRSLRRCLRVEAGRFAPAQLLFSREKVKMNPAPLPSPEDQDRAELTARSTTPAWLAGRDARPGIAERRSPASRLRHGSRTPLPGEELLFRQLVAAAGFLESDLTAGHCRHDCGFATGRPPLCIRRRQQPIYGPLSDHIPQASIRPLVPGPRMSKTVACEQQLFADATFRVLPHTLAA